MSTREFDFSNMWQSISSRLKEHGIEIDLGEGLDLSCAGPEGSRVKVVCVSPDLKDSVDEMGKSPREHVIMARIDEDTLGKLDAWVTTGAVKSRSEAAALFIREGLNVRSEELERLRDALREVDQARERLRQQAREVFGGGSGGSGKS